MTIGEKIITLRKIKGLSQEKLSEKASINLRTVQRIETGTTTPRGDTLQLIADALGEPIENFSDASSVNDKRYLQLINLSVLSFWILPFGNILLPGILWFWKKEDLKGVTELVKRILNFQILWTLTMILLSSFFLFAPLFNIPQLYSISPLHSVVIALVFYIINSILILMASVKINRGDFQVYNFSFKIIG
jgi:transcriptional regulator with XRE-family HTH domain